MIAPLKTAVLLAFLLVALPLRAELDAIDPLIRANLLRLGGGASVAIARTDSIVFRRHYGTFDDDTVVPIASATKWISAAVIMSLVDEGKLSLDDRVVQYIPSFGGAKSSITIRQLFSHTSGMPTDNGFELASCLSNRFTTLAACSEELALRPLIAAPGTEFNYGGESMQVGGRVAEIVEGRPWEQIFQRRIAQPLGLTTMTYGLSANPLIGGGVRSSLDDYVRFLQMILAGGTYDGRRILSAGAVEEMQKDQTFGVPIGYTPYESYTGLDPALRGTRYGLGEWRERVDLAGNAVELSSQGAFGFSPWIDRRRGICGVMMVQTLLRGVMPVYLELKEIVRASVPALPRRRSLR